MLSNKIHECLRHAEDCMQQAATQTDLKLRQDYSILAACWLKLIRELLELPADFSKPERQDQFTTPAKLKAGMEEEEPMAH